MKNSKLLSSKDSSSGEHTLIINPNDFGLCTVHYGKSNTTQNLRSATTIAVPDSEIGFTITCTCGIEIENAYWLTYNTSGEATISLNGTQQEAYIIFSKGSGSVALLQDIN